MNGGGVSGGLAVIGVLGLSMVIAARWRSDRMSNEAYARDWDAGESADPLGEFCNTDTNISSNSPISANIGRLLPRLVSGASLNGFISTSYGKAKNKLYGLAQCRGDISSNDCSSCIQDAAKEIRKRCPNQADARIWYDYCFLRYTTNNFFGEVDTYVGIFYYNVEDVTDPKAFNKKLGALMDKINSEAVVPAIANKALGKGKTKVSPFVTIYALVQCTRDLSPQSCGECLATATGNFPNICDNKKGCRVLYSSCYVRYEVFPFFFPLGSQESLANTSMAYYRSIVSKP
ncbi:hypothetical protein F0562_002239 [Nyssa sinensis]|uniref:Gnk2-homologous domain-containing protein n=1 Tax=Nyssa sinensis TaxID=561372 RepID=A0A5J5C5C2_9ASTE|nr:hypothetical protein F0562_002239 [Nyssa sinensis]